MEGDEELHQDSVEFLVSSFELQVVDRKRAIHHGGTERTEKNEFESVTYIDLGEPDVG
jgi:hypothetical protein